MLIEKGTRRPTKEEQTTAMASYSALKETLKHLKDDRPEIEIEETGDKVRIPLKALELLVTILKVTSEGKPISIVPVAMEMTTQAAADAIGCSRPHLIKILESGKIPFTKVGKHRRIKYEDVEKYIGQLKESQKKFLVKMMEADQDSGLYGL